MISEELARIFPNLAADGGKKTSEKDPAYNCVGWAIIRDTQWCWQPGGGTSIYWPDGVLDDDSFECYVQLFERFGYVKCKGYQFELLYEKVVLYAKPDGLFYHAAYQLPTGAWTSKLGPEEDIQHNSPAGLEGSNYGEVKQVLKRRCTFFGVLLRIYSRAFRFWEWLRN